MLYIEGSNDNKMRVREKILFHWFVFDLKPGSQFATGRARHTVKEAGLFHLVALLKENILRASTAGELKYSIRDDETVYGKATTSVLLNFPEQKSGNYYSRAIRVHIDKDTQIPIKVHVYDSKLASIEIYGYENLRLNAGLTDTDFDLSD